LPSSLWSSAADRYWDGGITGCNNPSVVAVTEAIVLGHDPTGIHVLSLGTGTVALPLARPNEPPWDLTNPRPQPSQIGDIIKLTGAILDDPPDAATFIAHVITGGNPNLDPHIVSRIVRMNPSVSPTRSHDENKYFMPAGWQPNDFIDLATTPATGLNNIERGSADPKASTLRSIQAALESAGIEFTNEGHPGIRLRTTGSPAQSATS
jgi:hypothetical protein